MTWNIGLGCMWLSYSQSKINIGKVLQQKLETINCKVRENLGVQQWRSTNEVLVWFRNQKFTRNSKFIVFDVINHYPSFTLELFKKSLDFAATITDISIVICKLARMKSYKNHKTYTNWYKKKLVSTPRVKYLAKRNHVLISVLGNCGQWSVISGFTEKCASHLI